MAAARPTAAAAMPALAAGHLFRPSCWFWPTGGGSYSLRLGFVRSRVRLWRNWRSCLFGLTFDWRAATSAEFRIARYFIPAGGAVHKPIFLLFNVYAGIALVFMFENAFGN